MQDFLFDRNHFSIHEEIKLCVRSSTVGRMFSDLIYDYPVSSYDNDEHVIKLIRIGLKLC